jgi:hypothetical protein
MVTSLVIVGSCLVLLVSHRSSTFGKRFVIIRRQSGATVK